ncbi:hypothetical protein HUO13_23085 [Saccharopolyspora erythraea]|nr:hypothetical protein HUO13_23085 [Saccharopolyspora erythraea]
MAMDGSYRRCQELVNGLTLPRPFSAMGLVETLAEQRGRPIHVRTLPGRFTVNACGAWVRLADSDVIFIEARTTRLHRDHILLHEIGHIICEHGDGSMTGREMLSRLLPDLSPQLVERLLTRTGYSTAEEKEAELVASLIRTAARTPSATGVLGELEAALGVPGGTA